MWTVHTWVETRAEELYVDCIVSLDSCTEPAELCTALTPSLAQGTTHWCTATTWNQWVHIYICIYITVIFLSFPLPRLRGCVCWWCICTVLSDVCLLYLCPHWLNNLFFLIDEILADLHQQETHLHTQLVKVKSVLFPSFCEKLKSLWEFSLLYWDH